MKKEFHASLNQRKNKLICFGFSTICRPFLLVTTVEETAPILQYKEHNRSKPRKVHGISFPV
jgi:hypothetical protein